MAPVNVLITSKGNKINSVSGSYHIYPQGLFEGRTTYSGELTYWQDNNQVEKVVYISRELTWHASVTGHQFINTVTGFSRRVGDQSSEEEATKWAVPYNKVGMKTSFNIFLLEGKALASGQRSAPQVICY